MPATQMETEIDTNCDILKAHVAAQIGVITIHNPSKHNIMTLEAWAALPAIVAQMTRAPNIRLIMVRGAGDRAFIAGADISEFDDRFSGDAGTSYDQTTVAAFDALRHCPLPTLAAISGFCLGGGLGLALSCDIRLARDDARFSIPAARLGLAYPASALQHLQHIVGRANAADILFSARQLDATEAHQKGLVQQVIAYDQFDQAINSYCEQIVANAPLTIQAGKYTLDAASNADANAYSKERDAWTLKCLNSADYQEGRRAFREKRPPKFSGQ